MRQLFVNDTHTDNILVFVRYSDTVDMYIQSPHQKVNDYMEEHEVILSYSFEYFRNWFPEVAKELLDEI